MPVRVHRLTAVDPAQQLADCAACGPRVPVRHKGDGGGRRVWKCRVALRQHKGDPFGDVLRRHGMTRDDYDALLERQGGGCAICRRPPGSGLRGRLTIDHDHGCCRTTRGNSCGRCVRGLLCGPCNTALGQLEDDPARLRAALVYLTGND